MVLTILRMWSVGPGQRWKIHLQVSLWPLSSDEAGSNFKHIWKAKIPYKIKIFLWLLESRVVLTKDNLIKRKWVGDPSCYFCSEEEDISHLFFCCPVVKIIWGILGQVLGANNVPSGSEQYKCWIKNWLPNGAPVYTLGLAAFCWAIWKRRNKACFEKKMLTNPLEILSHACALVSYWAGLCGADMQATILAGVKTLLSCAHRVLAQTSSPSPRSRGGSLKSTGFPPARPWTSLAALVEFLLLVYVASVSPSWDELSF